MSEGLEPQPGEGASRAGGSPADEARALLQEVVASAGVAYALLVGDELLHAEWNTTYRDVTPVPDREPSGAAFAAIWSGLEGRVVDGLRQTLRTGAPFSRDDLALASPRGQRWVALHARRVTFGGAPALLLVARDTTAFVLARRGAEEALSHALRRAAELDAVIDAIADGFVLYGPSGEVLRVNALAREALTGIGGAPHRRLDDLAERLTLRTADGKELPLERWPTARALRGEIVTAMHLQVELAGQPRRRWVLASAAPIKGAARRLAGAVLTFSDETALHELEEARDDLVRMISHDLRTPLQAVYTQAHLLRRPDADPAKVAERGRSIARSCERMGAMISDLVETTLLEAGQLPLVVVPLDLAVLLRDLLERLRGGLDVDRIHVAVAESLPQVCADPLRLERVLVNLLSNALKYSPAPSPVDVLLDRHDDQVRVSVTDRGVGISPEDQQHVFDRFYRARGQRRPEGLGLGLYITRLLVEAHHGRVEVESTLGRGTTFRVLLPAVAPE